MSMQSYRKDPDNIYFNARLTPSYDIRRNLISTVLAKYETTQNYALINNPLEYYITVTDFVIPLQNIPLTIARVFPDQPNPNLMTTAFSINFSGINYPIPEGYLNVEYVPGNSFEPPVQNSTTQIITPYYFVYSFTQLLEAFNNTLQQLYTLAGNPGGAPNIAPFFVITYDDLPKIQLIVSQSFINSGATISVNNPGVNYLDAFQYLYTPINDQDFFQFVFYQNNNISDIYGKFDINGEYYQYTQQYYALESWSPLSKIIILAPGLPIYNQTISSRNINSPDLVVNYPVLYSFYPQIYTISETKTYARYNIKEQYRLTDLISGDPLKKINIHIYWETHQGELFPIYLRPYECCEVQLGFFKKTLYNNKI